MTGVQDNGQDRVEVALAVVVDIHHVLNDPADQLAVIDDVIRHWRLLDDAGRQRYANTTNPAYSGLMRFAWEYVNAIDDAAIVDVADPCTDDAVKSARLISATVREYHESRVQRAYALRVGVRQRDR